MADKETIIIKKYANRRLYDTNQSSYITLDDLAEMIKKNIDFEVVDAKTGDDLTRSVLTQIIFEQEAKGFNLLPISFLKQIIGYYDHNLGPVVPPYLENVMENFVNNQTKIQDMMGGADFSPFKQFEEMGKKNMEMFEQTMSIFNPFGTNKKD